MTKEEAIRNAIASALVTAATPAAANIFPMRWDPAQDSSLPAICIYTIDSPSENVLGDIGEKRSAFCEVVLYETGPNTPATPDLSADHKLDVLREAVENVLNIQDDFFGVSGIARKTYHGFKIKSNQDALTGKTSERLTLACIMRYEFQYFYENQGA